jgi:mannose-1-phosphate guanylyltransferase/mannose-6-phosphate isomerase
MRGRRTARAEGPPREGLVPIAGAEATCAGEYRRSDTIGGPSATKGMPSVSNTSPGRVHAVVLAGGSGQRFWPLSRELGPKQLLAIFGTESLIAQAIRRVLPMLEGGASDVIVVTNEGLFDELRNHLSAQDDADLQKVQYLVEPVARNTAPAIALACATVVAGDPDGIVAVLPSDHILEDGPVWQETIMAAVALARQGYIATIGIKPTRPEIGYGYIRAGEILEGPWVSQVRPARVAEFVEKPDASTAAEYLGHGGYFWNAGIFVMRAAAYLGRLRGSAATAQIADAAEVITAGVPAEEALSLFDGLPSVSIDKAVMESCDCAAVVPFSMGWSDVGSLMSLKDLAAPDEDGNVRVGRGVDVGTRNTVVYATERLVATLGVEDLVVVDTADATLVTHKDAVQDVRQVVDALKVLGADEVVRSRTSLRPWGSWTILLESTGYKVKRIDVKPGGRLSLQRHAHRSENWVVVSGEALVTRAAELLRVRSGESVYVPSGVTHRIENDGGEPLLIIEVQTGPYLGEDDIERLADDWNRHDVR